MFFFSGGILDTVKRYKLSYVLTWRHEIGGKPFGPAIDSPSQFDFLNFYQDGYTLFLNDIQRIDIIKYDIVRDFRKNILPFWIKYFPDNNDSFYGEVLYDGTPRPLAPKGAVLNTRSLLAFSAAYRIFEEPIYKSIADRLQSYYINHFFDSEYGGIYWTLLADGTPLNTDKQQYAQVYGIFSLSEHYRATKNETSKEKAIEIFKTMDKFTFDQENGGYIETFTRDWHIPIHTGFDGKENIKSMNSHLHTLEAFTNLYRIWKDPLLKTRLHSLIKISFDVILDQTTFHQRLFFTYNWTSLEETNSYGHDNEFSWLVVEAAKVLGDEDLIEEAKILAPKIVDVQVREGMTSDGAFIYERGKDHVDDRLELWPQAESVVAFLNAYQISHDEKYLKLIEQTWNWIKNNMIDYDYGEWYSGVSNEGVPGYQRSKADIWRCPSHNGRMGLEFFERLKK